MPLDGASRARIAPFVTDLDADVYALVGLPEEVVAVLFAYATRTGEDLRSSLARLLTDGFLGVGDGASRDGGAAVAGRDRASAFHQRWVALYGHPSIAEHATLHLVAENVSLLAARTLEDHRLSAFAEKSTRFLSIDRQSYVDLPELGPDAATFRSGAEQLLAAYEAVFPRAYAALDARTLRRDGQSDIERGESLRVATCDVLRGLLPAALRTSVAVTANARALDALLSKLATSPLGEARRLGGALAATARLVAPRLVAAQHVSAQRAGLPDAVDRVLRTIYTPPEEGANATMVVTQPVRLIRHDKDATERVALALAYEGSDARAHAFGFTEGLRQATAGELESLLRAGLGARADGEPLPRAFESARVTMEIMVDYAAFRELSRHRRLTPATQRISCRLGFDTPSEITDLGVSDAYHEAMLGAYTAWQHLEQVHPWEAQYLVPLGFRVRALWTLDLRQLVHVVELRSRAGNHPSCRRIALAMYRSVVAVHPWLRDVIRVDLS
jgi:thymidylate synthase ThyX